MNMSTLNNIQILEKVAKEQGFLIYSRGGTVPFLTPDNFEKVFPNLHTIWHIPLSTVYEQPGVDVLKQFGKPFAKFADLENCTLLLNVNDSSNPKEDLYKYNEEKSISIWAPSGRRRVTPEEYMNVLDVFGVDICIPPSDKIPKEMAKKRCQKSCDRTVRFLDKCLEVKREKGSDMPIFGVLEGGDNVGYRQKCAKEIAKREVDGYTFSGYDVIGEKWKDVLISTLEYLPEKKLKILFGLFTPPEVIQAALLGINLFDTVVCFHLTVKGQAFDFRFRDHGSNYNFHSAKRQKPDENTKKDFSSFVMDLHDNAYTEDMKPLVDGCQCFCCSRYTRAYLHHLLVTKEMLAEVLLMMHNLTHWTNFIKEVKCNEEKGKLVEMMEFC